MNKRKLIVCIAGKDTKTPTITYMVMPDTEDYRVVQQMAIAISSIYGDTYILDVDTAHPDFVHEILHKGIYYSFGKFVHCNLEHDNL